MKNCIFKIYNSIFGDETWICKSCGITNSCEYSYCRNGCK